jgi:hypothetical protein
VIAALRGVISCWHEAGALLKCRSEPNMSVVLGLLISGTTVMDGAPTGIEVLDMTVHLVSRAARNYANYGELRNYGDSAGLHPVSETR